MPLKVGGIVTILLRVDFIVRIPSQEDRICPKSIESGQGWLEIPLGMDRIGQNSIKN